MNFLERWAWDVIPAVIVAGVLMYIVGLYVREEAKPKTCPTVQGQKAATMEVRGNMMICKYGR